MSEASRSSPISLTRASKDAEVQYTGELKTLYAGLTPTQTSHNQWPPSCTRRVFNLAMIKEDEVQRKELQECDSYVRMTITGKLDDILRVKYPIELKDIFRDIKGRRKVILLEGAPGCGKSTLSIFISQQWSADKLFTEFKVTILVRLRDPVIQNAKSIVDLFPLGEDSTMVQQVVERMYANDFQDVLFILDGWDELPSNLREYSIFRDLIEADLAEKNRLHKSAVIITSRPIVSGDLHTVVLTRVEVLGFTPKELTDYFEECLKGDSKAVETLKERIEDNPAIAGSCYLPLNASILVHIFMVHDDGNLPTSQYGIFSLLVCTCISRHFKDRTQYKNLSLESLNQLLDTEVVKGPFKHLCELAYKGVMDDRIIFSSLPDNLNTLSLLQGVESFVRRAEKKKFYNFTHLSIQELLAAFYMAKWLSAKDQVAMFNELFDKPHFSAVFQFYAATTKLETPGIREILARIAKRCRDWETKSDDEARPLLVALLHCLNEAQDISLCEFILQFLQHDLNLGHTTLSPTDCLSIGYFLSCACNTNAGEFQVNLFNCSIGDQGCKYLAKGLQKYLDTSGMTTETTLCMNLRWNGIHKEGSRDLCELFQTGCINSLNLNGNDKLLDEGAFHIAEKLNNNTSLRELCLYSCGLTAEGVGYIATALKTNNFLKVLNIGANKIGDEGIEHLAHALKVNHSLKTLSLVSCGMTDVGLQHIADSLKQNKSLTELKINNFQNQLRLNEIVKKEDALQYLTDCLKKNPSLLTLVLPAEFESTTLDVQEDINEMRRMSLGAALIKIKGNEFLISANDYIAMPN